MSSRLLVGVCSLALTAGALGATSSPAQARADAWNEAGSWLVSEPEALATAPNGDVLVITQGGSKVNRYNSSGVQLTSQPAAGSLALDIDVDSAGDVHQVLYEPVDPTGFVAVVGPDGQTKRSYVATTEGVVNPDSEFEPDGIALDASGSATLFESDTRVGWHDEFRSRYDAAGQRVWKTGGEGATPLSEQTDIASAPDGTTFVLDQTDEQVHVYDPAGTEIGLWGQLGTEPGRLYFATGLAVSPWGTIFVTDRTARVQEFSASGTYLDVVTTPNERNGGVDFGPGGELYVLSDGPFEYTVLKFVRGTGPTPTPGAATAKIAKKSIPVRRGRARLSLTCAGSSGQSCEGRVVIQGRVAGAKKSKPLARAAYAVEVGRGVVKMKLTRRGRAALKERKKVAVSVVLKPREGAKVKARAKLVRR